MFPLNNLSIKKIKFGKKPKVWLKLFLIAVPEFEEFCWLPGGRIQKECKSCSHIAYIPWRLGQMRQMTYEPEMAMEYAQGRVVRVYGTSCAEVAWFYMDAKTGEIDPTRFYAPVHISQDLLYLVRGELVRKLFFFEYLNIHHLGF